VNSLPEEVVVLRMAALSVTEGIRLAGADRPHQDDLVRAGVELAANEALLAAADGATRAAAAVRRYVLRMSTRPTPFGLFAGACVVPVGRETNLVSRGRAHYTARAWIDAEALEKTVAALSAEGDEDRVPLRPNPTLRLARGVYRYRLPGTETADVVAVRATPAIGSVIAACGSGPASTAEMVAALIEAFPGAAPDDLRGFVRTLAERGLLLSDSGLLTAGAELSDTAAAFLRRCGLPREAGTICRASARVGAQQPLNGSYPRLLGDVWDGLARDLPLLAQVPPQYRYHVELQVQADGTVGRPVLRSLARAVARLDEIFPPVDLAVEFRQHFQERYGDATVPLLEAADPEHGVLGRGKRNLSRIAAGVELGPTPAEASGRINSVQSAALDHWLRTGVPYDLGTPRADHPGSDSTGIIAQLIGPGGAPMTAVLFGASPRSPAAFLARFSSGRTELSARLREQVRATAVARAGREDVMSAEVVFSPAGRIGNVIVRPALCDETISLNGATGGTLTLDRLLLRAEGDRLAVYDAVTRRPVVLFLSSAHGTDADHLDPLYTLLANVCQRATQPWTWGALSELSHLPRVCCGDVIVSPERWRLTGAAIKEAIGAGDRAAALRSLLPDLGDRRWLGIGVADQRLAIDTTRAEAITEILGRHTRDKAVELTELPHVEHPAVRGPQGDHVAEIAIGRAGERHRRRDPAPQCAPLTRPDWVYAQYFCGASSAEQVIAMVAGLSRRLRAERLADRWFFIRYGEGGNHIRARIRAVAETARPAVLAAMEELGAMMLTAGVVTSFRMEPYLPEVRRYGGPAAMPVAEELFTADSDDIAARVADDPAEADRLLMAGSDVYAWWGTTLGCPDPSVATLRQGQRNMTLGTSPDRKVVGKIIREHRKEFDRRFKPEVLPGVEAPLTRLAGTVSGSWGEEHLSYIVGSVVHMHCNRLFAFDQRRMEYLAYELAIQKALQVRALTPADGRSRSE
jgi:lantibiotic biosynthesis protein